MLEGPQGRQEQPLEPQPSVRPDSVTLQPPVRVASLQSLPESAASGEQSSIRRTVSVESFGPSHPTITELPKTTNTTMRYARLPTSLHHKVKDLLHDLQVQLGILAMAPRCSNLELCLQSSVDVLQHLCLAADLDSSGTVLAEVHEVAQAEPEKRASHSSSRRRSFSQTNQLYDSVHMGPAPSPGFPGAEQPPEHTPPREAFETPPRQAPPGHHACEGLEAPEQSPEQGALPTTYESEGGNSAWMCADVGSRRRSFHLHNKAVMKAATGDATEVTTSENKCYVHPEKPFRLGWDFCSMMLILALSVVIPLEVCFFWETEAPLVLVAFTDFLDVFFSLDIVLNFFTAFHEGHGISGRLVTDFAGIAKHYMKTWLAVDLVASFPWLTVINLLGTGQTRNASRSTDAMGMLKVLRYAKVARMMKVLRVLKLASLIQLVEEKLVAAQSMTVAFQLLKMTVVMLVISHNVACGWYAVAIFSEEPLTWLTAQHLDEAEPVKQYIASFYFAITTGTTVGYGDIHPVNYKEQVATVFVLVLSVGYIGQFLARVSQMVASLRHHETAMVQSKRDAMLFMQKRGVQKDLQLKVLRYIEHVYETDAITALDEKTMKLLSESLQNQLALAVTGNVLRQFPLFEDVEVNFLTAICQVCRTRRAGVGDTMVAEEQAAHEMFWVVRGEAAVLRRNFQVGGLRAGDWFGELALFFPGAVRTATVRCETHCEFVVLHHLEFQQKIELFPKVRREYDKITTELRKGNPRSLKLRCSYCGSLDHFSRDCTKKDPPNR